MQLLKIKTTRHNYVGITHTLPHNAQVSPNIIQKDVSLE
jgi:hypothetical protein